MNKEQIKKILPHREPMLLVDEAELTDDNKAKGKYTVKGDEFFLQGHFPNNPVVPGVMLCEMMAQTCAVLISDNTKGATPYFTGLDKIKFKNMVHPGDTVEFECEIINIRKPFYFAKGKGTVNGKATVMGEFSFALLGGE